MPIDYGSEGGEWIQLPRVGDPDIEVHIAKAEKVEDKDYKYNFTKKEPVKDKDGEVIVGQDGKPVTTEVNQGFRWVFTCVDGKKFSIASWSPFFAFRDAKVDEGDAIRVSHPEKGVWKIKKVKASPATATEAEEEAEW